MTINYYNNKNGIINTTGDKLTPTKNSKTEMNPNIDKDHTSEGLPEGLVKMGKMGRNTPHGGMDHFVTGKMTPQMVSNLGKISENIEANAKAAREGKPQIPLKFDKAEVEGMAKSIFDTMEKSDIFEKWRNSHTSRSTGGVKQASGPEKVAEAKEAITKLPKSERPIIDDDYARDTQIVSSGPSKEYLEARKNAEETAKSPSARQPKPKFEKSTDPSILQDSIQKIDIEKVIQRIPEMENTPEANRKRVKEGFGAKEYDRRAHTSKNEDPNYEMPQKAAFRVNDNRFGKAEDAPIESNQLKNPKQRAAEDKVAQKDENKYADANYNSEIGRAWRAASNAGLKKAIDSILEKTIDKNLLRNPVNANYTDAAYSGAQQKMRRGGKSELPFGADQKIDAAEHTYGRRGERMTEIPDDMEKAQDKREPWFVTPGRTQHPEGTRLVERKDGPPKNFRTPREREMDKLKKAVDSILSKEEGHQAKLMPDKIPNDRVFAEATRRAKAQGHSDFKTGAPGAMARNKEAEKIGYNYSLKLSMLAKAITAVLEKATASEEPKKTWKPVYASMPHGPQTSNPNHIPEEDTPEEDLDIHSAEWANRHSRGIAHFKG